MGAGARHERGGAGVACLLALFLAVVALPALGAHPVERVIVRSGAVADAAAAVADAGGSVRAELSIVDGVSAIVPRDRIRVLEADPRVRSVTPDARVWVAEAGSGTPTATVKSVFAQEIGADRLWASGIDGAGVGVAIIDTGVTPRADFGDRILSVPHPSRAGSLAPCADFSGENSCLDTYGHGTFIAGLIAGDGTLSGGKYKGVAPKANLISIKIAGRDGSADVTKVLAAIQYVVSFKDSFADRTGRRVPVRVLNLSLGTDSTVSWRIDPLNFAVQRAWRSGIAVVVSAGNRGPARGTVSKPADDPLVITVGAVDDRETPALDDDRLPRFSSRGPAFLGSSRDESPKPDVVAPGGRVISLRSILPSGTSTVEQRAPGGFPDPNYRRGSGTSMSAGVVSGAAALLFQARPDWTPNRLKFALTATAQKVAERNPEAIGAGLINVANANAAPPGEANLGVTDMSSATGALDGTRGSVYVTRPCNEVERSIDPNCTTRVDDDETAQGRTFDSKDFVRPWTSTSWYEGQWNALLGSSWYGSSWYGCTTPSPAIASCWYGSSWYGSSWYGSDDETWYGTSLAGSSWYGAWQ